MCDKRCLVCPWRSHTDRSFAHDRCTGLLNLTLAGDVTTTGTKAAKFSDFKALAATCAQFPATPLIRAIARASVCPENYHGTCVGRTDRSCALCPPFSSSPSSSKDISDCTCTSGYVDIDPEPTIVTCTVPCSSANHYFNREKKPISGCSKCAPGNSVAPSRIACVACPAGSNDEDGNSSTACSSCDRGMFSAAGATSCTLCARNTFASAHGSTRCTPCPAGKHTFSRGANTRSICMTCSHGEHFVNGTCVDTDECTRASPTCSDNDAKARLLFGPYLPYITGCSTLVHLPTVTGQRACEIAGQLLRSKYATAEPINRLCECQCAASPCKRGGACVESRTNSSVPKGEFYCKCVTGWAGVECETPVPCALIPCGKHGLCAEQHGSSMGYSCTCDAGWSGHACDVGLCASSPCENGGICSVNTKGAELCKDGPECKALAAHVHALGTQCTDINAARFGEREQSLSQYCPRACAGTPCVEGTTLGKTSLHYECACATGFRGAHCEVAKCLDDPHWKSSSATGATCSTYRFMKSFCAAHKGTSRRGITTSAALSCSKSCGLCAAQHKCGDMHADCPTLKRDLEADGFACQSDLGKVLGNASMSGKHLADECCATCSVRAACSSSPCHNGGTCHDTSTAGYACSCNKIWSGATCRTNVAIQHHADQLMQQNILRQCRRSMNIPVGSSRHVLCQSYAR